VTDAPVMPRPSSRTPRFGFGEPKTAPLLEPEEAETPLPSSSLPHPSTASPLESLEHLEPASADDYDEETSDPGEWSDATPSRASTRGSDPAAGVLDDEALRDVFRGGVIIAGDQAHQLLAKSEGARAVGLYATDEEDAERIGDPLARIAGRHQGIGKVNPDTADLLAAMVGLTRYATKQITRGQAAKQLDAGYAAQATEPVDL